MQTMNVNGHEMAYLDLGQSAGNGPPLVCVHGSLSDFRIWSSVLGPLTRQHRVIAPSLRHFFPDHWDGVGDTYSIAQHVDDVIGFIEKLDTRPVDLMGHSRGQRRGAGRVGGIERGVELAARLGQDQPAQQIRPPLRDTKADVSAAGMAHQVDRSDIQLLDEADHVVDMLRDRIGVADAVPMVGKEMPQRRRDHAVLAGQGTQHRRPDPEIAQRAVDANKRRAIASALADIEIGHVIAVDVYGLHGIS